MLSVLSNFKIGVTCSSETECLKCDKGYYVQNGVCSRCDPSCEQHF